jgi:hypothetical protein
MKNFEQWETQDIEIALDFKQIWESYLLDDWLAAQTEFNAIERQQIEKVRKRILQFADYWNEDELKLQAISIILDIVDYQIADYNIFSQRYLSSKINDIEIGGRVDFMLAKGRQKPITPYFFIHEYKQERKGTSDPKGQLLAELAVAQVCNDYKFPMYGCYVVGRNWFFMVLKDKEYAVSNAFNSSDEDIYQIIAILRKIKDYILKLK